MSNSDSKGAVSNTPNRILSLVYPARVATWEEPIGPGSGVEAATETLFWEIRAIYGSEPVWYIVL